MKAAGRALDVFEAFGDLGRPLTLTELSRQIEVPASSCFALIQTLLARGYLYSAGRRRAYYPTKRMLAQARSIAANDPLAARLADMMHELRDATGETVIMGKGQGRQVIYLDLVESPQTVRYATTVGALKPLHSSAMGKALLGWLDDEALARTLDELPLPAITSRTVTSRRALEAEITVSRSRGWYMTRGENVMDVMAVATTVVVGDEPIGITVAGPIHRMDVHYGAHARSLVDACRSLEAPSLEAPSLKATQ